MNICVCPGKPGHAASFIFIRSFKQSLPNYFKLRFPGIV